MKIKLTNEKHLKTKKNFNCKRFNVSTYRKAQTRIQLNPFKLVRFDSDSIQIRFRFDSDSIQIRFVWKSQTHP